MRLFRVPIIRSRWRPQRASFSEKLPPDDSAELKAQISKYREMMNTATKARRDGGDFVPENITRDFLSKFNSLTWPKKKEFLSLVADTFRSDETSLQSLTKSTDIRDVLRIREALVPLYEKVWALIINHHPEGMKEILSIRAQLLEAVKERKDDHQLNVMSISLKHQLSNWLGVGFLKLQKITWDNSATILEKIITYSQTIHGISSWNELKVRIGYGHRCFAFFHSSLPNEPIVFIEVALTSSIPNQIVDCTTNAQPEDAATCAIFYAIISTQKGLRGIDLGHLLITRVVDELRKELPGLTTFSTLSPIPGFRNWLEVAFKFQSNPENKFSEAPLLNKEEEAQFQHPSLTPIQYFQQLLHSDWTNDANTIEKIQKPLTKLVTRYLFQTKKRGLVLDPVANFHLHNGALIHRINWLGDRSPRGMKESYGLMVNYLYSLPDLRDHTEAYLLNSSIACSDQVRNLLKE